MHPVELPKPPWFKLGIDVVGPLKKAPNQYRLVVTLIDYYSKRPAVFP